jgi:hypothetical protein
LKAEPLLQAGSGLRKKIALSLLLSLTPMSRLCQKIQTHDSP